MKVVKKSDNSKSSLTNLCLHAIICVIGDGLNREWGAVPLVSSKDLIKPQLIKYHQDLRKFSTRREIFLFLTP